MTYDSTTPSAAPLETEVEKVSITEADLALNVIAAVGAVVFGAMAVQHKDLMRALLSYALASAFVAMLFFLLVSPFAAVLELTVGAGLIVVLFLVALTLSMGVETEAVEGDET